MVILNAPPQFHSLLGGRGAGQQTHQEEARLRGEKWSRTHCLLLRLSRSDWWWEELFPNAIWGDKRYRRRCFPCLLIRSISTYNNQGTFEIPDKIHSSASIMSSSHPSWIHLHVFKKKKKTAVIVSQKKGDDWDRIFSVWQSGQYWAAVIKPLPVKHPAVMDEFPPGEGGSVTGLEGQGKRDFQRERVLESIWKAIGDFWLKKQRARNKKLIGFNRTDLQPIGSL